MFSYTVRRLLQAIPVLIAITILAFLAFYFNPADPVVMMAGERASPEMVEQIRARFGLDEPAYRQYFMFVQRLMEGDLGTSYRSRQPVMHHLVPAYRATLTFISASVIVMLVIGVPAGIASSAKPHSKTDNFVMAFVLLGLSAPIFWVGIILIWVFSLQLGLLPSSGFRAWYYVILPAFSLGIQYAAIIARVTRTSMLEVLSNDYIRTARAKGVPRRTVFYSHALKNAAIPVITTAGLQIGSMLGGTILIESVVGWPGVGRMLVVAITQRDAPIVQGSIVAIALSVVVLNLIIDWLYALLDPRIRYD